MAVGVVASFALCTSATADSAFPIVEFQTGSADLTERGRNQVKEVADSGFQAGGKDCVVFVVGYVGPAGGETIDPKLLDARAGAIKAALVSQGLEIGQFEIQDAPGEQASSVQLLVRCWP